MGKKPDISPSVREVMVRLSKKGLSQREIGKITNSSKGAVQNALKLHSVHGVVTSRPRPVRKKITTVREDRILVNISLKNRRLPSKKVAAEFLASTKKKMSPRTVRHRLQKAGLGGRRARKKPWLSERNIKKRLEWAKNHVNWTYDDWCKVVFSDETNIEVG